MQFLGKDPQALTDVLMPVRAARLHEDYLVDAAAAALSEILSLASRQ
jgi:hypothetical protein